MSAWRVRDITEDENARSIRLYDGIQIPRSQRLVQFTVSAPWKTDRTHLVFIGCEPGQAWNDLPRPVRAFAWRAARAELRR